MRVRSKLADVEFLFGGVERKDNGLVITSHPSQTMKSKVYVSPQDVTAFLGCLFRSPSALFFVLGLPIFWFRARGDKKTNKKAGPGRPA
jgi:hypothetical protein